MLVSKYIPIKRGNWAPKLKMGEYGSLLDFNIKFYDHRPAAQAGRSQCAVSVYSTNFTRNWFELASRNAHTAEERNNRKGGHLGAFLCYQCLQPTEPLSTAGVLPGTGRSLCRNRSRAVQRHSIIMKTAPLAAQQETKGQEGGKVTLIKTSQHGTHNYRR